MSKNGYAFYKEIDFSKDSHYETLLKNFGENQLSLRFENFKHLLTDLLKDSEGKSYNLSNSIQEELFSVFDRNNDDIIDLTEFIAVCKDFIKPLIKPVTALLIIDVQNDFIDGSLALKNCPGKQDGKEVIAVINNLLDKFTFDVVAYTLDFHPEDHISFYENASLYKLSEKNKPANNISVFDTVTFEGPPEISQKLWPVHCVEHTWGSKLHKDLLICKDSISIFKGTNRNVDSYSAFFDNLKLSKTALDEELKKKNVTHVFICGLAFDYCVSFTAIDAAELGYATVVIQDATRGTDKKYIEIMEEKLKLVNCVLADSVEVENLITGKDRRAEFASTLMTQLKKHP